MNRQDVFDYIKKKYKTEPDYPWFDDNAVLRHADNNKWYGLIMEVGRDKLGLPGEGTVDVLNIKCDPILAGSLRQRDGFHPAYHLDWRLDVGIRTMSARASTAAAVLILSHEQR